MIWMNLIYSITRITICKRRKQLFSAPKCFLVVWLVFKLLCLKYPLVEEKEHPVNPSKDDRYSYASAVTDKNTLILKMQLFVKIAFQCKLPKHKKIQKL